MAVVHLQELHIGAVEPILHLDARHLDLLHQLALVGIHRVQAVEHVVLVDMGRRVAQGAQRVQGGDGLAALGCGIDALGLVDDDHGIGRLDKLDGAAARHPVVGPMDDVRLVLLRRVREALAEGIDVDDHDLNAVAGRKVPYLSELLRVVDEIVEPDVLVEPAEVFFGDLERLVDALLDGHRGNHDDELGETVGPVQLEDGAQIHIGLARPRLHLHGEVHTIQRRRRGEPIAQLHRLHVRQDVLFKQP